MRYTFLDTTIPIIAEKVHLENSLIFSNRGIRTLSLSLIPSCLLIFHCQLPQRPRACSTEFYILSSIEFSICIHVIRAVASKSPIRQPRETCPCTKTHRLHQTSPSLKSSDEQNATKGFKANQEPTEKSWEETLPNKTVGRIEDDWDFTRWKANFEFGERKLAKRIRGAHFLWLVRAQHHSFIFSIPQSSGNLVHHLFLFHRQALYIYYSIQPFNLSSLALSTSQKKFQHNQLISTPHYQSLTSQNQEHATQVDQEPKEECK